MNDYDMPEPPWWLWAIGVVCMTVLLAASFFAPHTGCSISIEDSKPHHTKAAQ